MIKFINKIIAISYERYYLYFFISIILISCESKRIPVVEVKEEFGDSIVSITEWLISGAFTFDTLTQNASQTINNRDFDKYQINEDHFRIEDLKKMDKSGYDFKYVKRIMHLLN